jgi:tetratricopeptide (TPR) repeat protein
MMTPRRFLTATALALCCFLALAVAPLRAAENDALEQRFRDANAKLDAGETQPALEIYNEILEAEPKAGNVWVMRAIAKWKLKDTSGARADLAQAIALHPDNVDAYRVRGQLRYELKDYANSLTDFTKAIDLMQANVETLAANDDEAASDYEKSQAELFGMRAEVKNKLDDSASAIGDLTRAIELKPDYVAAFYLRGQLREATDDPVGAEEDYSKTIDLSPEHADALNQRAWLRFHALKWESAIADGTAALAVVPQAGAVARVVGYAHFGAGNPAAAVTVLTKAADLARDDVEEKAYALFIRHLALKRTGTADDRLATALADWKDKAWLSAVGRFLCGQISEDELDAAMEKGDETDRAGQECEGNFYIGMTRLFAGDRPAARSRFKAAIATGMTTYIEYTLAQAELARMKS